MGMTMAPQDDLTAERAATLIQSVFLANEKEWRTWYATANSGTAQQPAPDGVAQRLVDAVAQALKTARQEALREAVTKIRQRGDEYMRDCEAKDAAGKKYRDTYEMRRVNSGRAWAFKDLADELDRLASEGGT